MTSSDISGVTVDAAEQRRRERIARWAQRVALVGLSSNPRRGSNKVFRGLLAGGYDVFPVNPNGGEEQGRTVYRDLSEVPLPIDLVQVFRPSEETPQVARQAVQMGATVLWLQEGIDNDEAREIAEAAGLEYVSDVCLKKMGVAVGRIPEEYGDAATDS